MKAVNAVCGLTGRSTEATTARTVLAAVGGASWYPVSASLPEPPPLFSYQAPISAYHCWPSASDMFCAASVFSSRVTYFTVASIFSGAPVWRPFIYATNGAAPDPTPPRKKVQVPGLPGLAVSLASTVSTAS